jgi:L-arabinose isomerase
LPWQWVSWRQFQVQVSCQKCIPSTLMRTSALSDIPEVEMLIFPIRNLPWRSCRYSTVKQAADTWHSSIHTQVRLPILQSHRIKTDTSNLL